MNYKESASKLNEFNNWHGRLIKKSIGTAYSKRKFQSELKELYAKYSQL